MKKFLSIVPRWFPALAIMFAIFAFSSQPGDNLPDFMDWDYAIKKMGHVIGYGLLGLSYFHFLRYDGKQYWLAWLMVLIFSATDEFHQSFVPGRQASFFDVLIFDNLGAAFTLWLYFIYWRNMKKKFTRRDFLKVASIGTASTIALSCGAIETPHLPSTEEPVPVPTDIPQADSAPREADVLVLGAGISGLAAARTLVDKGLSVIMLEARDRIGGRMWTDTSLGLPLDLGASWIHGVTGNPITELAKQFGVQTIASDYDNGVMFDFDGRAISDAEYKEMEDLFDSIYSEVEQMQENADNDIPLQQAFDQVISSRNLSAEELHRLEFVIQGNFALELGADPQELSLLEWDQDEEFGGEDVVFPGGYNQITDGLAKGLDIRLGVKVTGISYGADGVDVETSSGAYGGDKVIVTFPLGVLKQAEVKFDPPLPESKQSAMDRLDMGVLNKVYLKFSEAFWDEEAEGISYMGERTGEWCDWLNFVPYINEPVLMAFHGGAKGYALEELSDDEIIAGAMKTLRVIYGDEVPEPEGYVITRWGKDPFAFGSYSHVPPFASGDDYDALFAPVDDVLYFAGEATSREYPATVHGAYLSGVNAAHALDSN